MDLQELCDLGQDQLMRMEYAQAERTLAQAEALAFAQRDFDTLARLYMPLQETRRQKRQRCAESIVRLDLVARGPADDIDPQRIARNHPAGQFLIAGWGTIRPAIELRRLAAEKDLYVEAFLGATFPTTQGNIIVIAPLEDSALPPPEPMPVDDLRRRLPPNCLVYRPDDLPRGPLAANAQTQALTMAMWESLHLPFLKSADALADPVSRIDACRTTIRVDYACELAHQRLSDAAHTIARHR